MCAPSSHMNSGPQGARIYGTPEVPNNFPLPSSSKLINYDQTSLNNIRLYFLYNFLFVCLLRMDLFV